MDPNIINYANAEAQGTGTQFNELLLGEAPHPDIATVANNVLNRMRDVGDGQVLDDPRYEKLDTDPYEFRVPALANVSARTGNDVENILRLVDKRVYESLLREERVDFDAEDHFSGDLRVTRELPEGLGRFLRESHRLFRVEGWRGLFAARGQRDVSLLGRFSPKEQRLQRRVEARLAAFDPTVPGSLDYNMVARELARLAPQRLLFELPRLRTWAGALMIPTSTTNVLARVEEVVGRPNMNQASIIPVLSYLRGNPAHVTALQDFYVEAQGGDVEGARTAFYGTAEPGLKPVYDAEKKRHEDVDEAFKSELEAHDRARRNYESDENGRIGRYEEAATKLSTVQSDLQELLGIPGKIASIDGEIAALPVTPATPPVDQSGYRRGDLEKEKRQLTDRQADLRRSVIRRYQEYAGEFSNEITANAALFSNTSLSTLDATTIASINDTHLESLTRMMAQLRARKRPEMTTLRTALEGRDAEKRTIEARRTAWEEYKKTPYEDRANPAPATCLPTGVTLTAPHARLGELRIHDFDSLKSRHDDAQRAFNDASAKVADSPFKKTPLPPETLLYELQLREPDLATLTSPEKEMRAMVRTMILLHEARSHVNEGATRRRAEHIHVGAQRLSGIADRARGGMYRPFDDIQRDTFIRDERLKGVEGLTLKSSVQDILTKVGSGALNEEQLHLYIHQLELLAQDSLEGANLAHGEDVRGLIHNCRVVYYTLKARSILQETGDRSGPLDKATELRAKILEATKPSEASALAVETARVATNRIRLEKARAEAEAEAEADGPAHQRAETVAKWGELAFLVLGTKGVFNVMTRVGQWLGRSKTKQLPPS